MPNDTRITKDDRSTGVFPTIWDRLRRRAWSRAGAVAAVVSTGPTRRVLTFSTRLALLVTGSALIASSVAVTLWNDLGPGPLDVFISAIALRTGLPLAVSVWVTVGSLMAFASLLGRRPGLGTLLSPLLIGPILQTVLAALDMFGAPQSIVVRIVLHVIAIAGIGVGSGALIVSGLGAGSGELFARAASERVGRAQSRVRPVIEATWIVVGVALGGPAGFGTVLVGVLIAPAVANGYRFVDTMAARSVRGLANTHDAIIAREMAALRARELVDQ